MSHHQLNPEPRTKVVISDSTLHEFFVIPSTLRRRIKYKGDIMHADYITIPGGDLDTLTNAFRLDYVARTHDRPLDVCVVAGYNDLVKGYTRDKIDHSFQKMVDMVKQAGPAPLTNTVAIATFMYPPQLAWLPDNDPLPYPDYRNNKSKIDWLNEMINQRNRENGVPNYPGFHTYGIRTTTRRTTDLYGQHHHRVVKSHRWEHWRESDPTRMLHLRDDRRVKMGVAVNKYFVINT